MAGALPPLYPRTNPRSNHVALCPSGLPSIVSTLKRDTCEYYLSEYPDQSFVDSILNIIYVGACISHMVPSKPQMCKNLRSATDFPGDISKEIESLRSLMHIHGPFQAPPFPNFRCSPLGTSTRKRSPKCRVFNHYSWPPSSSVNAETPDTEGEITYEFFHEAMKALWEAGRGAMMEKLDLKDAYCHILVRSTDWHLLGFHWLGKFYYPVVLMFSGKSAPYIFNLFAEGLHWIIQRHIPAAIWHYLDDFLSIFKSSTPRSTADAAVEWIESLGNELGLSFQPQKTIRPCTVIEFLGLELDSDAMEARLPKDKLTYLREMLENWKLRSTCSLKEVQELTGFLQFCAQVIPCARAFICRLINFSTTFLSDFARRHIPAYARADLRWWSTYADSWNGVQILEMTRPTIQIYTDASGVKGLGGIHEDRWFSTRCPRRFRNYDIQFKETYAVLQAILRWGHLWKHSHVVFNVDNTAVVHALSSGTNRNVRVMNMIRMVIMLAAQLDFSYSSSWLPSHENSLADSASRFEYNRLFSIAPSLRRKPCSPHPPLSGIRRTLTSRPVLRSSYGTASRPRPEQHTRQVKNHSQTLSSFTPNSATQMVPSSQRHKQPCWNGSDGSEEQNGCSPRQSSHMSPTCGPLTSTPTSVLLPASPRYYRGSYGESNGSWEKRSGTPNSPLPATCSEPSWMPRCIPPSSEGSTLRHLSPLHSQVP